MWRIKTDSWSDVLNFSKVVDSCDRKYSYPLPQVIGTPANIMQHLMAIDEKTTAVVNVKTHMRKSVDVRGHPTTKPSFQTFHEFSHWVTAREWKRSFQKNQLCCRILPILTIYLAKLTVDFLEPLIDRIGNFSNAFQLPISVDQIKKLSRKVTQYHGARLKIKKLRLEPNRKLLKLNFSRKNNSFSKKGENIIQKDIFKTGKSQNYLKVGLKYLKYVLCHTNIVT